MDDLAEPTVAHFGQPASGFDSLNEFESLWQEDGRMDLMNSNVAGRLGYEGEKDLLNHTMHSAALPQPRDNASNLGPPAECIRYNLDWKTLLKTRRVGMDIEQDVDVTPSMMWDTTLHQKVDELLERKFSLRDRPEPNNTTVVASSFIEDKLESWRNYYDEGKRLALKITFRFQLRNTTVRFGTGSRGRQSATRRMRNIQAFQRDAKEHAIGQLASWRTVYSLLRCPGRPCQNS